MNPSSTSFILGYHGCDRKVAEKVLAGRASLTSSHNDHDWLGDGIYFWEHNARRAYEYAREIQRSPRHDGQTIRTPAVIGAIIDPGSSLNLLDSRCIAMVRQAYEELARNSAEAKLPLSTNRGGTDLLSRKLDCAVMRALHQMRQDAGEEPLDTVRAAFIEGSPLYDGAGFFEKTHIQICVCNPQCIKGYFRPLAEDGKPLSFGT